MKQRGVYWSAAQNTVLQKLLRRARHHVNVIFVPGSRATPPSAASTA
jgi:hypothetical protein